MHVPPVCIVPHVLVAGLTQHGKGRLRPGIGGKPAGSGLVHARVPHTTGGGAGAPAAPLPAVGGNPGMPAKPGGGGGAPKPAVGTGGPDTPQLQLVAQVPSTSQTRKPAGQPALAQETTEPGLHSLGPTTMSSSQEQVWHRSHTRALRRSIRSQPLQVMSARHV